MAVGLGRALGSRGAHWGPGRRGAESVVHPRGTGGMPNVRGMPEAVVAAHREGAGCIPRRRDALRGAVVRAWGRGACVGL